MRSVSRRCAVSVTGPRTDTSFSKCCRIRSVWGLLAKCHEVRNLGEYEGDLNVDERLLTDLIAACKVVAAALDKLPPPT
jgi:hypothetical protein